MEYRESAWSEAQTLNYIALCYLELVCDEVDPTQERIDAIETYLNRLRISDREALSQKLLQQFHDTKLQVRVTQ